MPNTRIITVTKLIANDSVPIVAFDGDGALAGPSSMVITATNDVPLTPNDPSVTIQVFPSGNFANGTDGNGNIGVIASLLNLGNDKDFGILGDGVYSHAAGLWPDRVRVVLTCTGDPGVAINIQYNGTLLNNLTSDPPPFPSPTDVAITNITSPNIDPGLPTKMDVTIRFANPDTIGYPNLHAMITRSTDNDPPESAVMVGTTPILTAGDHTFVDIADVGHTYKYYVYLYDASTLFVTATPVVASAVISADPSGVYQITPGKTHDTIYNSHTGPTTVNQAIPTPFIKTGFIDG